MEKKKVLIIAANDMGNSGVPNVFMQIVRNLHDKYSFDIIVTRENYFYKDEFLSYGGNIFLIKEKFYKNKFKRIWWRLFGTNKNTKKELDQIFHLTKYDIVHSFKEAESWIYLREAKRFGIKKRIIHNNRQKEKAKSMFIEMFNSVSLKKSLRLSTDNVSVSEVSGKSFFGNNAFEILYNTYSEEKYFYRENAAKKNELTLLQVGTFLPLKNQVFSLDVTSLLKEKYPNIRAVFIGNVFDENFYSLFNKKLKKLNLHNNVDVLNGNVDQTEFLNKATFTLMPSICEGLSLTAIESQVCGIKVFASTGLPTEVDIGNVVFLPLDAELWANSIVYSFETRKNERIKVDSSKFSNKSFKEKMLLIYEKTI